MSDIVFDQFVRKPFTVNATLITEENIDEIAKLAGEIKYKGEDKYIALDRRVVPNVARAFVGWWVTTLDDNLRFYAPHIFEKQFIKVPESSLVGFEFKDDDVVAHDNVAIIALSSAPAEEVILGG